MGIRIFSRKTRDIEDLKAGLSDELLTSIMKTELGAELMSETLEAILDGSGKKFIGTDYFYNNLKDPSVSDEWKKAVILKYMGGIKKNRAKDLNKREVGVADFTDDSDAGEESKKGCVSDIVFSETDSSYDALIDTMTFEKVYADFEDARQLILSTEGVDIFRYIAHLAGASKITSAAMTATALERLKCIITEYNLEKIMFSVMQHGGALKKIIEAVSE